MNSIIISALYTFCIRLAGVMKKSIIYRAFMKIYNAFSLWWQDSGIINFLKRDGGAATMKSSLYKIIYLPFSVLGKIGSTAGDFLSYEIEHSAVINAAARFMNSALALNSRFIGFMLIGAVVGAASVTALGGVVVPAVIGMAVAVVLIAANRNITDFIAGSGIVKCILAFAGFENISWDFYEKERTGGKITLIAVFVIGVLSGAIALNSPILAIIVPAATVGVCVVMSYPITGVFFAAAAAPFVPTMALAGICFLTFCSLVINALRKKDFKWKMDEVGCGLGFFLVFMLVSSLFSFAVKKSVMVWGMYLIFVGFYFVIINTIDTKEQLYSVIKLFTAVGFLVSIYGILQYIFGWNTNNAWIDEDMFEQATMRAYSTMENPNVLGEYLLLIIPLAAAFMLRKGAKIPEKCFYAAVFLSGALCMVFTQSRGCWLGLILAAMIFVTFYNGKLWGLLPVVLIILPFVIPETMADRMMSVGNLEDSSTSYRVFIWRGTLSMLRDFWIGGIGMGEGAFRAVYPLYSFNGISAPHSHNTFLQLLVEGGIAGLAAFVIIMIMFLKKTSSIYRMAERNSSDALIALAIGSGTAGFMMQSMFDYTFYNYRMMAMFFMMTAFASALKYCLGGKKSVENN